MVKMTDQLDDALEDLLWFSHELAPLLRTLRDAMPGQPGAASYDSPVVSGHSTVLDEHGVPMPAVSDRTGETAVELVEGKHPAAIAHASIARRLKAVQVHADALVREAKAWKSRPPTLKEQRETAAANEPQCELHLRAGFSTGHPRERLTEIAGGWALDRPYSLCAACRRRIASTHRIPSAEDVQRFEATGKWPLMLETNYRGKAS